MHFEQATDLAAHETIDTDHGRVETRRAWVSHDVDWLRPDRAEPGIHRFPSLAAIGMVEATVEHKGQTSVARRYFLSSAPLSAAALLHATRAHWGVENRLHWVMDVFLGKTGRRPFDAAKAVLLRPHLIPEAFLILVSPRRPDAPAHQPRPRQHGPDPSYRPQYPQEYHQQDQSEKPTKISGSG